MLKVMKGTLFEARPNSWKTISVDSGRVLSRQQENYKETAGRVGILEVFRDT